MGYPLHGQDISLDVTPVEARLGWAVGWDKTAFWGRDALVAQKAFRALRAPIEMVTAPHTPVPFSNVLEDLYIPDPQRIANAIKTVAEWTR